MITWQWSTFDELSTQELYDIFRVRLEVFAVEQEIACQDADNKDQYSDHLMGWLEQNNQKELVAYLRIVPPGKRFSEPSIGRVLTMKSVRGQGLGKEMTQEAIRFIEERYPKTAIRISSQEYITKFYEGFGFRQVSGVYIEEGIPHVEMLRDAAPKR